MKKIEQKDKIFLKKKRSNINILRALKESYKDSFIDNLQKTGCGVEQTLDKVT